VSNQVLGTDLDQDGIAEAVIPKVVIKTVMGDFVQQVGPVVLIADRYSTGAALRADPCQKIVIRVIGVACLVSYGVGDGVDQTGDCVDVVTCFPSACLLARAM
jgi:hypothetical protein